jgi:hypothetical protein
MSPGWFRRSRENDPPPEAIPDGAAGPPAQARPRQQRPPLHIRNLLLLNLRPQDGIEQIETAPPLGSRAAVVGTIHAVAPGIRFDGDRGELAGEDFRITIDLGAEDPVRAAVAAADGDAGIEILRALLERSRWRAYAPKSGVFIGADAIDLFALPQTPSPTTSGLP